MDALDDAAVRARLANLPEWTLDAEGMIRRTFAFGTFMEGIDFVNRLARAAESAEHHPDVDIRYTKITVALTTHDAGGLTEKDFSLAQLADEAAR